jgi:hypothetical protein
MNKHNKNEQTQQQKLSKFIYIGNETRFSTKPSKKTSLSKPYTTRHNIGNLLTCNNCNRLNKYEGSGVYDLECLDCNRHYTGQTDVSSIPDLKNMHVTTNMVTKNQTTQNIC